MLRSTAIYHNKIGQDYHDKIGQDEIRWDKKIIDLDDNEQHILERVHSLGKRTEFRYQIYPFLVMWLWIMWWIKWTLASLPDLCLPEWLLITLTSVLINLSVPYPAHEPHDMHITCPYRTQHFVVERRWPGNKVSGLSETCHPLTSCVILSPVVSV